MSATWPRPSRRCSALSIACGPWWTGRCSSRRRSVAPSRSEPHSPRAPIWFSCARSTRPRDSRAPRPPGRFRPRGRGDRERRGAARPAGCGRRAQLLLVHRAAVGPVRGRRTRDRRRQLRLVAVRQRDETGVAAGWGSVTVVTPAASFGTRLPPRGTRSADGAATRSSARGPSAHHPRCTTCGKSRTPTPWMSPIRVLHAPDELPAVFLHDPFACHHRAVEGGS